MTDAIVQVTQKEKAYCGARKRYSEGVCKRPAGWGTAHPGTGKCKLHGGSSLSGVNHPNFKHGLYIESSKKSLASKIDIFLDADPFNLMHELALMRAILAELLEKYKNEGTPVDEENAQVIMGVTENIGKMVDRIVKIRNETALTAAEVTYLATKINELINRYIDDPTKRETFIRELFSGLPREISRS